VIWGETTIEPSPGMVGEGAETSWRAPLGGEDTVRLSSKGESDRMTQRSAVQIRSPQPWTPLPKRSGVRLFVEARQVSTSRRETDSEW